MPSHIVYLMVIGSALVLVLGPTVLFWRSRSKRDARRNELRRKSFPAGWVEILHRDVPLFAHLPTSRQTELQELILVFLDEKRFEGCGGLELTEEMCVVISAQACILLLGRKPHFYPRLKSILVYPTTYNTQPNPGSLIQAETGPKVLGESWGGGTVILAWDSVLQGAIDIHDGHNVVIHEFAHQLDQESGSADGAPVLDSRASYGPWARILGSDYAKLCKKAKGNRRDVLDPYGATNPAEFFAVATETFFEKPRKLQEKHPELYDELQLYYQINPLEWR